MSETRLEALGRPHPPANLSALMAYVRQQPDGDTLASMLDPAAAWYEPESTTSGRRALTPDHGKRKTVRKGAA